MKINLGLASMIITGINVKETVIFPERKVALSASILIIVARLGLTSLYSPLILKVFLKCLLAYFPYLYLLGINSSSSSTSDRCIAFLHPYQIIMIIFARWIKKVSRRISQGIRLIHVKANRFCEQECQFL